MEVKDDSRAFNVKVLCVKEVEEYYFLSPRRLDSSLVVLFYWVNVEGDANVVVCVV